MTGAVRATVIKAVGAKLTAIVPAIVIVSVTETALVIVLSLAPWVAQQQIGSLVLIFVKIPRSQGKYSHGYCHFEWQNLSDVNKL